MLESVYAIRLNASYARISICNKAQLLHMLESVYAIRLNALYARISICNKAQCIMKQSVFHLAYQRLELEVFISSSCLVNILPELKRKLK